MSKLQRVYREIRPYLSRDEARYAAPRIVAMTAAQLAAIRAFGL